MNMPKNKKDAETTLFMWAVDILLEATSLRRVQGFCGCTKPPCRDDALSIAIRSC